LDVALFGGKEAALIGPVFVDATQCRAVLLLLQERTFENQLTTRAAAIALASSQRQVGNNLPFLEVRFDETTQFSLRLSSPQFSVVEFPGAEPIRQSFFKRALARNGSSTD